MESLGRRQRRTRRQRRQRRESTLERRPGQAAGGKRRRPQQRLDLGRSFVTFCTVTSCYRISRNGLLRAVTEGCKTIRTPADVWWLGSAQTGACTVA